MDRIERLPDVGIGDKGIVSRQFLQLGINRFIDACRYVHQLPYGYNSDRDDLLILFKERFGSCTTKHAVIASLAQESGLSVEKHIGIYAMTEAIVDGTAAILDSLHLPYAPMVHCFLVYDTIRVDLTEGNHNGKNRPLDHFLHQEAVPANISAKEEYLRYRKAVQALRSLRPELGGIDLKRILQAREQGLALLRSKINPIAGL